MMQPTLLTMALAFAPLAFAPLRAADSARVASKPNILLIVADDLNDWIGALGGHPQVKTPHLDRLAARGTLFTNAHCQAPLCNPSRNSFLSGLRPSTLGNYGLKPGLRDIAIAKNHVTLPQAFTRGGYATATFGKVYHDRSLKPADAKQEFAIVGESPTMPKPPKPIADLPAETRHPAMDWGPFPENDADQPDFKTASAAIEAMGTAAAAAEKPFFVAAGFRLPHVPCFASQRWFDLYPDDTLVMPPVLERDRDDTPRFSWYMHWKLTEPRLKMLQERNEWRPLVRAYLASVSFMDAQVGRVLDALDASGQADNTIVVFFSDHGWHLGEKAITGKNSLWERSTRVPLILAGPGIARGTRCHRPAELLDLFPTLIELAGFPARGDLEGHSLVPLCQDANAPREWPAITTHNQGNHAVRSERWRYIRYADGSEELYDLIADPNEWTNLANDPKQAGVKREHARWLPKKDLPPAPGSEKRVLTYDPATGAVTWEGEPIRPDDLIPQ